MALDFVKNKISCFQFTSVVVDIFDRYDIQNSIKKAERDFLRVKTHLNSMFLDLRTKQIYG
jgi:hypothetical protein